MVADAAVSAASRAWRSVAAQLPQLNELPADGAEWAAAHLAAVIGCALVAELRTTAHELRLGEHVVDFLDHAQRQLLDAHEQSCLQRSLNAVCAPPFAEVVGKC